MMTGKIPNMPLRPDDGNKGTFGRVCVIGGCGSYIGAPVLCGKAAYRCGCGLVECIVPEIVRNLAAGSFPEAIWNCRGEHSVTSNFVYVLGPGMGQSEDAKTCFRSFLKEFHNTAPKGLVIDADGLNFLAKQPELLEYLPDRTVLTPHPGEMSRLCGCSVTEIQARRMEKAIQYSEKFNIVLLLKGAHTVIAAPGNEPFVLPCASSALAKAGSGDVLSGVVAALLAQRMSPYEAAVLGASLHAKAGLMAAENFGNDYSVMAMDIVENLPSAIHWRLTSASDFLI